jgi:LysM repeat protein
MSMNYGPETVQYTIQADDSLWDLADEYNTTAEAIMAVNPGLNPHNLYVGQVISIPGDPMGAGKEQFRRFGPGFRGFRPGFGRPFRPFGFPFRRFRPIYPLPVPMPYPVAYPYYCPPYDPYCQYYPY